MVKKNKLTEEERDRIAVLHARGIGVREIARLLDRNHASISRELKRNRFGEGYNAIHAQKVWEERKSKAGKRQLLKDKTTYSYVLKEGWSPEQIAGRLQLETGEKVISYETIYQFIYKKSFKEDRLWEYLPRKQKQRHKKHGRKAQKARIPQRVSIHERPVEIDKRIQIGHWEGDTVEGRGHNEGIHTEVERVSRFLLAKR